MNRGIECSLKEGTFSRFLEFVVQGKHHYYVPWCLKNESTGLTPKFTKNFYTDLCDLQEIINHGLWELVLQIYPPNETCQPIETYDDYIRSTCHCCIIYYDCGFLDVYVKSKSYFEQIWRFLISIGAEDMTIITDENDKRSAMHP